MTLYTASFQTVTLRLLLMMAVVLGSFAVGAPILAVLALPIFLSAMLAISFTPATPEVNVSMKATKSNITAITNKAA